MLSLHLSEEEARLLHMVLQARLSALAVEISHTDTREFRDLLQDQWGLLESTLSKLSPSTPSTVEATGFRRA